MILDSNYYLHDIPGRMRIKIPLIKNNPQKGLKVCKLIEHLEGIEKISLNSLTGSVVIYYKHQIIHSGRILNIFKENGFFDESKVITNDHYIQNAVSRGGQAVQKIFLNWALGKALEGVGLAFLAALI